MDSTAKQILLIENDPHMARVVPRRLTLAGYQVVVAHNVEEAHHALAYALFQLAIIDIRVSDDRSDSDTSGFMLARQLPPAIPCLFHTAHDTKENIREALGSIGAEDIIAKDDVDAPVRLLARVEELFRDSVGVNFDLTIDSSVQLPQIAQQLARANPEDTPAPQATDLTLILRRLFREATTVHLTPLFAPETNAPARSGAVLLRVQERRPQGSPVAMVLKLGSKAAIASEAAHYRASKPYLGGQRLAQLEGEAYSRRVGGLLYSLIGAHAAGSVHPLSEVLFTQETDVVINLLDRFFSQTFSQIFADAQPATLDLTEHYTTHLGLTVEKLRARVRALDPTLLTRATIQWPGMQRALPNPLALAIHDHAFRSLGTVATHTTLCHGDLHSRNILVDEEQHFWLIDFARASLSHSLRDFAELETDIKFQVLSPQPLADFVAFESALAAPSGWEEEPTAILLPTHLQQAFDIIVALRRIARERLSLSGSMEAYYQALFWHALNVVRMKTFSRAHKRQALVAAALVTERLQKSLDRMPADSYT